jgi:hypothetical protein
VSLRPNAFLDMITRMGGDPFAKRRLIWFDSPTSPLTFVLTQDLAGYLAEAVDARGVDGQGIDIGWNRPVSMHEIAQISGRLLGQQIRVRTIPAGLLNTAGLVAGRFNSAVKDMDATMRWCQTGQYVADPTASARRSATCPPRRTRLPNSSAARTRHHCLRRPRPMINQHRSWV